MATNDYIENTVPAVKFSKAILTKYPLKSTSTLASSFAGALTVNGLTNTGATVGSLKTVTALVATAAPTQAQSGTLFTMSAAAGFTVTLPAPVVGTVFDFVVITKVTSNAYKWITDAATTFVQGAANVGYGTEGDTAIYQGNGSTHISFNMNGTTQGGDIGSWVNFTCIGATATPSGLWQVTATSFGSTGVATPFATS